MLYKSALTTSASGSVGGMTASRNRGGQYLRARAVPHNPNTPFQQAVREAFGMLTNAWAALMPGQRTGWTDYATNTPRTNALGDTVKHTPLNMFLRTNTVAVQSGIAVIGDAPPIFNIGATPALLTSSTLTHGVIMGTGLSLDFTVDGGTSDDSLVVYLSRPQSPTIVFFRGPYRWAGVGPADTTTLVIEPADLPFTYLAGQQVFVRAVCLKADGRVSAEAQLALIVA